MRNRFDQQLFELNRELIEMGADGIFKDVTGVMPGESIVKKVTVENKEANDAWVRVKVDKLITLADGNAGDADTYLRINYNTGNGANQWTKQGKYFYYNSILKPGTKTSELFSEVLFDESMGNEYQRSTAQVYVYAQATQVDSNGSTALEANGWPVETNNNN